MNTNIDEIRGKQAELESKIKKYQDAIEYKLAQGEFDVDNMCAQVNQWERLLTFILKQLRACDPCNTESHTEQDRKAIAVLGGGKGVEIRPRPDDPSKYTVKKRLNYSDILQKKRPPQPNGKAKQPQPQQQTANV